MYDDDGGDGMAMARGVEVGREALVHGVTRTGQVSFKLLTDPHTNWKFTLLTELTAQTKHILYAVSAF